MIALNLATATYAQRNGIVCVLKMEATRQSRSIKLAEEEQATRPMLRSYEKRGRRVEIFRTEKSGPFEAEGWTCLVDGELVGFGFRNREKAESNALSYVLGSLGRNSADINYI
jgi:hypothetical protein